ncbi:hypothetical protein BN946_scf184714.g5 [Trametes cinnabarina]|uniref:Aminoglycoside phosphotransferase domain-containing protein n=1 Tax=Pycnoporus cinnabarinus TaxID=5643 RepID=A0A060STZ5_PYCCI|nr:hypothetical protein BN946_scf184714.g5 [Trametes cinnabarina]
MEKESLEETPLPSWAEMSAWSEEDILTAFAKSAHRFPSPSLVNPVEVRRIAVDAVMRVGPLQDYEVATMRLVHQASSIPVPAVRRVFDVGRMKAMVLEYIPGKTLGECWAHLGLWQRFRIIWSLRGYIRQLRRIPAPYAMQGTPFPGPVASEPQLCVGPMFTEYGAGPFASYEELTTWFMHKLDVNRRITKFPPEPMTFDSSMPLVLTHLDLHPRNILVDPNHKVWLIDWEFAGFYPQWFEYAAMRGAWSIFGRWERLLYCALLVVKRNVPLKFGSPLDRVFKILLLWFKAHYKVITYHRIQEEAAEILRLSTTAKNPPESHGNTTAEFNTEVAGEDANLIASVSSYWAEPDEQESLKPTTREEKEAAFLGGHAPMLGILLTAQASDAWRPDDKVGDRVPDDYEPRYPIAPGKSASPQVAKRRKMMSMMNYHTVYSSAVNAVPVPGRAAKSMPERR